MEPNQTTKHQRKVFRGASDETVSSLIKYFNLEILI